MEIANIVNMFDVYSPVDSVKSIDNGHINITYLITLKNGQKYVLQKINNYAFKDIDMLMSNISLVSNYLTNHGFESLVPIKTLDGHLFLKDENSYYRLYVFIDDTVCYEKIDNIYLVYNDGKAFGKLHRALAGFDASSLGEIIPNFHNTWQRYLNLKEAIKEDKFDKVKLCKNEIAVINSFENEYSRITDGIKNGEISLAVTHNDPKINNVLFDKFSGSIRAIIDLDTVMPGSYLYDFGDALRSLFTGENEDSENLSSLTVDLDIFEAYSKGYLSEMNGVLTPKEIELLPFAPFLIAMELAMRFLEDYLRGDIYFKTSRPNHNLIRARTQLYLAQNIVANKNALTKIIKKLVN